MFLDWLMERRWMDRILHLFERVTGLTPIRLR